MSRRPVTTGLPERHLKRNSPQVHVYTGPRRRWQPLLLLLALLVAAAVLVERSGVMSSGPSNGSGDRAAAPAVSSLVASGPHRGRSFSVGSRIRLSWKSAPAARRYRLQIVVTSPSGSFAQPTLSAVVARTSYTWHADAPGTFLWRVQGQSRGAWGPPSHPQTVTVAAPLLPQPRLLMPRDGARVPAPVRFCWSRVRGANAYYLWIFGRRPAIVSGRCETLRLRPGRYFWSAASVLRGERTYTSQYAPSAHFTVPAQAHKIRLPAAAVQPHASPLPVPQRPVPQTQPQYLAVPTTPARSVAPKSETSPRTARSVPRARAVVRPTPAPRPTAPPPTAPPALKSTPAPGATPGCIPLYTC